MNRKQALERETKKKKHAKNKREIENVQKIKEKKKINNENIIKHEWFCSRVIFILLVSLCAILLFYNSLGYGRILILKRLWFLSEASTVGTTHFGIECFIMSRANLGDLVTIFSNPKIITTAIFLSTFHWFLWPRVKCGPMEEIQLFSQLVCFNGFL